MTILLYIIAALGISIALGLIIGPAIKFGRDNDDGNHH